MNKNNNKGFMLLETLIVSTIILGTLVFLYIQFVNIKRNYDISFRYNTVPGLYIAKEFSGILAETGYENLKDTLDASIYHRINCLVDSDINTNLCNSFYDKSNIKQILFVRDDLSEFVVGLQTGTINDLNIKDDLKKFIIRLTTKKNANQYRIIIEFENKTYASIMLEGA